MYKKSACFLFIINLIFLTSCSSNNKTEEVSLHNISGELTVYYMSTDKLYEEAIVKFQSKFPDVKVNSVVFEDHEAMNLRLTSELSSGKGPDLFLLNSETSMNTYNLVKNGVFEDVNPYMAKDATYKPDHYNQTILETGIIDKKRYLVPASYNVPYVFTTEEKIKENNIIINDGYGMADLMEVIHSNIENLKTEDDRFSVMPLFLPTFPNLDYMNFFMQASDVKFIDYTNKTVNIDTNEFRKMADLSKVLHSEWDKALNIAKTYNRDFTGVTARMTFFIGMKNLPCNTRYYDSLYQNGINQTLTFLPIPTYKDSETYTAFINLYMGMNANSKNKNAAYMLMREIMDCPSSEEHIRKDLPVNNLILEKMIEAYTQFGGQITIGPKKRITLISLSEERKKEVDQVIKNISNCVIPNSSVNEIIKETMSSYYTDTKGYDEVVQELKQKLTIYLNE